MRSGSGYATMGYDLLICAMVFWLAAVTATSADADDPFLWLEEVHGAKALDWVKTENARSVARLEGDQRYDAYRREALAIFTAKDRISLPEFRAMGVDNIWQDDAHPHGVWRHATLESYRSGKPKWETLIDLDALSKAEGRNWFLKGVEGLPPEDRYCLVQLSDGGGDAIEIREFDTMTRSFVDGGFKLDRAKQSVEWIDRNTLLVARPRTPEEATTSGYAFTMKVIERGRPLTQAKEVFRGEAKDAFVVPRVLRDADGHVRATIAERRVGFFQAEYYLIDNGKPRKLSLPQRASLRALVEGQLIVRMQEAWAGFEPGALLALDLAAVVKDPARCNEAAQLIMPPGPKQTIDAVNVTRDRVIVQLLDEVKGAIEIFARKNGKWVATRLDLPKGSSLVVRAAQKSGALVFVTSESFLQPTTLWWADAATGEIGQIAVLPARFKASTHVVEQDWATSLDGTKIPYFLVHPKQMKANSSTPTLLFGYGGFQLSKPPVYLPEMGKLWLERGGAYAIANIRGGGEFGPAWHQSALRDHRQRAFDDFAAVAEDLIKRKVTSPRRLGIYGRSNGGVLTTVSMTQRPDLFNAIVVESPLVDMLRYHKLSAGASWIAEYGNPDVAGDRSFIAAYSAYQKVNEDVKYPEPYITTNTEDDRVHPGHARKFAARLKAVGAPYLYYENTFGGHANDADPELNAKRWARHYVYLAQKLMD
jgi:prolyl oligopeptidase